MTRRGWLAGALAAAAMGTAPVLAQTGQPVEGGGSFAEAPVLAAGTYSDTIRLTEKLFYAVDLAEGQRLSVRAIISGARPQAITAFAAGRLSLYSPARSEDVGAAVSGLLQGGGSQLVLVAEGGVVGGSEPGYEQAGTYFITVSLDEGNLEDLEYPVTLTLSVAGAPASPTAGPTAGPTSSPSPVPTPTEVGLPGSQAEEGWTFPELVVVGAGSFGVGALVGGLGMALRRLRARGS
ncbi:MAG: hypothetical protein ACRDH8_04745 [Actinomycetota bacterium]